MITLKQAEAIIAGALSKAASLKLNPICVVVLDGRASLKACVSQDGTSMHRHKIAHGKANGAVALGMGSRALMGRAEQQAYFIDSVGRMLDGDFIPVPGGVLIRDAQGQLLGAVGISGDSSDNDEAACVAGIEAAGLSAETG